MLCPTMVVMYDVASALSESHFIKPLHDQVKVYSRVGAITESALDDVSLSTLQKMNSCFNPVLVTSVSCLCALHY